MSLKRRLIVTFDAFGTLFKPKDAIGLQYARIAENHGLSGFTGEQLTASFSTAYRKVKQQYPNYGRASGMGASKWWSNVIQETFAPVVQPGSLPSDLVPDLLQHFSTAAGYSMFPDVQPFFQELRRRKRVMFNIPASPVDIVVGIISNSDDRIGPVLESFSLSVSPRRFPPNTNDGASSEQTNYDFDFIVLSFDVGFAKPDRQIFDAAKICSALPKAGVDLETNVEHVYVHVGDDPIEDYQGAEQAGWKGVRIGGHGRNKGFVPDEKQMLFIEDLDALWAFLWKEM